jgi:hypothetical protein
MKFSFDDKDIPKWLEWLAVVIVGAVIATMVVFSI